MLMTEWWTYRPSDFLLFSPRTYYRLFELYNADVWPAQLLTAGLGLALWVALWRGCTWAPRVACLALGAAWLWVAWAFHWQRFAAINWAATWFAAAFAVEGLLLLLSALPGTKARLPSSHGPAGILGLAMLLFAVALQPGVGSLMGRPWIQAEAFALAPDPTTLATLGVLLLLPARGSRVSAWLLWPLPLLWCLNAGMTLATMGTPEAWLLPAAASVAVLAAVLKTRAGSIR
jgi:hypothetical protein